MFSVLYQTFFKKFKNPNKMNLPDNEKKDMGLKTCKNCKRSIKAIHTYCCYCGCKQEEDIHPASCDVNDHY